ncbi:COX15/CtaA family protein [Bartonella sp. TP]|uniref:COX15/CtaA family protein n=1 Tax=Bartonella sp. TP TaxID=3057550 RepID=UPI0025B1A5BB|nr:COX15/CtaA family protein [Bartonella sp. TP]MDN5248781.1 COX15/CtaA family protein [Alphaproteobacteria bacterium]WJW80045.1 COX15/CtaA family protein [Bartonella sp. TP]
MRRNYIINYWLYAILFLCLSIVIVGGATRLTGSGLSITQWQPIHGVIPPLNVIEWQQEFTKYQQIAQYQQLHQNMSLAEFQHLYWWEWAHRILARLIGFIAILPLIFYLFASKIKKLAYRNYLAYFLIVPILIGIQGVIGWWMVYSGLAGSSLTSVSQYRLAMHMIAACSIIALLSYMIGKLIDYSEKAATPAMQIMAALLIGLILLQIYFGALVAGLHGGLSFNSWPLMNGQVIPKFMFILQPYWRNYFENIALTQFIHRSCAYLIFLLTFGNFLYARIYATNSTHHIRSLILLSMVSLQIIFGITTLLLHVPIFWALLHQIFALLLLVFSVLHYCATKALSSPTSAANSVPQHR